MPNISSVQDYDHGPAGAAAPATRAGRRPVKLAVIAAAGLLALAAGAAVAQSGPFDIRCLPPAGCRRRRGRARLVYADSPFGVAVTEDGRARYDVR